MLTEAVRNRVRLKCPVVIPAPGSAILMIEIMQTAGGPAQTRAAVLLAVACTNARKNASNRVTLATHLWKSPYSAAATWLESNVIHLSETRDLMLRFAKLTVPRSTLCAAIELNFGVGFCVVWMKASMRRC